MSLVRKLVLTSIVVFSSLPAADLVVFSYNRPMQLYAFLESAQKYLTGVSSTVVIYRAQSEYQVGYDLVKKEFKTVRFISQQNAPHDFAEITKKVAFKDGKSKYILFAVDDIFVKSPVDLNYCIDKLEQHQAYSFLLRLGLNVTTCYMLSMQTPLPEMIQVAPEVYKYKFSNGKGDWSYPNNADMSLYRKVDIEPTINSALWNTPNHFEGEWAARANLNQFGLVFMQSKIVNIPINMVNISSNRYMKSYSTIELLERFLAGQKIDLEPITKVKNSSPHMDYEVSFVERSPLAN